MKTPLAPRISGCLPVLLLVALTACETRTVSQTSPEPVATNAGTPTKPAPKAAPSVSPPVAKPAQSANPGAVQLELIHELGADADEQLSAIVDRYNAMQSQVVVKLTSRDWHSGATPDMVLLKDSAEGKGASGRFSFKPLHEVMSEAGEALDTLSPPPMLAPAVLDAKNRLVALPVVPATPVLYLNKNALRKAGVPTDSAPATWQALQDVLGKLYDRGVSCPYTTAQPVWVHIENTSAWHNEQPVNSSAALATNGLLQVKHMALMSSWYKSRYMHVFGRGDEADARFLSGECAALTSASSRYPGFLRRAKFDIAVLPLPHHEDYRGAPQNTLIDGPSLWVPAGKGGGQYKAVAQFVRFLLDPQTQVELERKLGALPVNRAGLYAARGDLLKSDLLSVRVAIDTLTRKPATESSRAFAPLQRPDVRLALNEALEQVWANKKPPKQALDDAVARVRKGATVTARQ